MYLYAGTKHLACHVSKSSPKLAQIVNIHQVIKLPLQKRSICPTTLVYEWRQSQDLYLLDICQKGLQ